jgi:hypothetical protein
MEGLREPRAGIDEPLMNALANGKSIGSQKRPVAAASRSGTEDYTATLFLVPDS